MSEAWVTLATNDVYSLGCLVLAQSLRHVKTTRKLHCMITDTVSQQMREQLGRVFDCVSLVQLMDSADAAHLALIERPDLGVTFTKLHCWTLTQYQKCVFLDADTLLLKNCDELFERDEFSAAPDIGWPDMFNSGVFVFAPNEQTYTKLIQCALEHGSFDGGDQGLLNTYFSGWRESEARYRLPFIYNMSSSAVYTYAAAYKRYQSDVKIVHFLGVCKPWHYSFNTNTHQCTAPSSGKHMSESPYTQAHLVYWWSLFVTQVQPQLQPQLSSTAPSASSVRIQSISVPHTHSTSTSTSNAPTSLSSPSEQLIDDEKDMDSITDAHVTLGIGHLHEPVAEAEGQMMVEVVREEEEEEGDTCASMQNVEEKEEEKPVLTESEQREQDELRLQRLRDAAPLQRVYHVRIWPAKTAPQAKRPDPAPTSVQSNGAAAATVLNGGEQHIDFVALTGGVQGTTSASADVEHQRAWEAGFIDYTGRDSWDNIQKRLDQSLSVHK